jgi:hypothetical protein
VGGGGVPALAGSAGGAGTAGEAIGGSFMPDSIEHMFYFSQPAMRAVGRGHRPGGASLAPERPPPGGGLRPGGSASGRR